MAIDSKKPPRVPVARPAVPSLGVTPRPEPGGPAGADVTAGTVAGWAWSLGLHAFILLVMAFWYFAPRLPGNPTIDGRLAGNEFGADGGIDLHGGLESPLGPDEGLFADPLELTPVPGVGEMVLSPEIADPAARIASADAGGGAQGNPGIGDGQGFGIARFGSGGETIRGVEVKVGDPQFTLIWDTEADIDLHVIEPGGAEIYWEVRQGRQGGELDVDDVDGFGPENVYWLTDSPGGEKVKGRGPAGEYRWFVHYFGGLGGISKPTNWKVRVKHDGKVDVYTGRLVRIDQRSKVFSLKFSDRPAARDRFLEGVVGNPAAGR